MENATYIEQTPDSGYIVNAAYDVGLNTKNWLLRLDINGDTLWTQTFSVGTGSTNPLLANSMASVNNFLYGLTGFYNPPSQILSAYFIASIGNGFLLSSKIYNPSIYGADSRSIDKTYDDGFIMAGTVGTTSSTADVYLIRTNSLGDTIWTRTYDRSQTDAALDVKQTIDSGFIVAATYVDIVYNIYLIKTDSIGDTLWTKSYHSPFEQNAFSIEQTTDGGFIATGTAMNSALERSLYLIKINSTGDTLWTRKFCASINCIGYFVRQAKDGGFIISGVSTHTPAGAYLIKTDSMGMVSSNTGIAEVNNPFSFNIFPNPTTGIFTIEAKGASKNSTIKIYNVTNECIYSDRINNHLAAEINLSNQPNGIYMVVLNKDSQVYSKKIIIDN